MLGRLIRITAAAVLIIAVDMLFEISFPAVREINIQTEKLKKGEQLTLLQISDFHGNPSKKLVKRLADSVRAVKPDAILITGDLADRETRDFGSVYALIKELYSICPDIYFVSGNHEWSNPGREKLLGELKDKGVVLLNNNGIVFDRGGTAINICGVDDPYSRRDDITKTMKGMDSKKFTVLLSHSPRIRDRLGKYSPDLILCGHTHGGQIRLPFIGAVIAPGEGLFPEYDKGMFRLDGRTLLYIDSGVGTSTLSLRFLNRSQISVLRIEGNGS